MGDLKLAALFFDKVIPISDPFIDFWNYDSFEDILNFTILKNLINIQTDSKELILSFNDNIKNIFNYSKILTEKLMEIKEKDLLGKFHQLNEKELTEQHDYIDLVNIMRIWSKIVDRHAKTVITEDDFNILLGLAVIEHISIPYYGCINYFIESLCGSIDIFNPSIVLPPECLSFYDKVDDDMTISFTGIPIIDTKRIKWDTIIDFRNNIDSRNKLRNLRLFLFTNYEGKSRAFIEDDLSKRLDDYNHTCREYGFETKISIISSVLDSKNIQATFIASAAAAIFGEPFIGAGALLTGASIEIGKICIEILKRKHAFHKIKRDHPLAYLIDIKTMES